jgi:hypothetical protein
VEADPESMWIRGGTFAALGLAAAFFLVRRWRTARFFAALAAACAERWREMRLASDVHSALSKAGREA